MLGQDRLAAMSCRIATGNKAVGDDWSGNRDIRIQDFTTATCTAPYSLHDHAPPAIQSAAAACAYRSRKAASTSRSTKRSQENRRAK
jgi:hypothetical protein